MSNILADHRTAVVDLLTAGVDTFFDGAVPSNPPPSPPYVVGYVHIESLPGVDGNTLSGVSATVTTRVICHCVGSDAVGSMAMAWQARSALLDVTPAVAGRSCAQILQESSAPPARDETTGSLVMDQVDVYRFNTYPA